MKDSNKNVDSCPPTASSLELSKLIVAHLVCIKCQIILDFYVGLRKLGDYCFWCNYFLSLMQEFDI